MVQTTNSDGKKSAVDTNVLMARAGASFASSLSFQNVSRTFGDVHAVKNVSLEIEPGETLCLLGESGCGKTTLLRIAAGIETVTAGNVLLNGKIVAGAGTFVPPEKRGIGLVFQDYALFPHLNILQNVTFGLTELKKKEAEEVARQILVRVGMEAYEKAYPHMLSGGQQQRIALARAIAPRPNVLLLDEPFSGLDSVLRASVRHETMSILNETGATSIVVTHDPEEAMLIGDRIALLKGGSLVQLGTPDELYNQPKNEFVAGFFGEINRFDAVVEAGKVALPLGNFDASSFKEGSRVAACIRAEGINIVADENEPSSLPGQVVSEQFVGDSKVLSVLFHQDHAPLRLKIPAKMQLKSKLISLLVDPQAVLIFTKE